jgi:hypothetical protein
MHFCVICRAATEACCADCEEEFYCSLEHQRLHWPVHKRTCSGKSRWKDSISLERAGDSISHGRVGDSIQSRPAEESSLLQSKL